MPETAVSESEIYRSAGLLIAQYGDRAPARAAIHTNELLKRGDRAQAQVWERIRRAAETLLREAPGPEDSVH